MNHVYCPYRARDNVRCLASDTLRRYCFNGTTECPRKYMKIYDDNKTLLYF